MKTRLLAISFLFYSFMALSQNQPVFRQWFNVSGIYNPALVGDNKARNISLLNRRQWVSAGVGPVSYGLLFQYAGSKRLSYGISFTNQSSVRLNSSDSRLIMAYRVPLTPKSLLRFGMSLGLATRRLHPGPDDFSNDPAVLRATEGLFGASGSFGVVFEKGPIQLAAALPAILPQENYSPAQLSSIGNSQLLSQWYSVRFREKNEIRDFSVEAWSVYRLFRDQRSNWEMGAKVLFQKTLSVGTAFNSSLGAGLILGFELKNGMQAGYCWEPGFGTQNAFGSSHELRLAINTGELRSAIR